MLAETTRPREPSKQTESQNSIDLNLAEGTRRRPLGFRTGPGSQLTRFGCGVPDSRGSEREGRKLAVSLAAVLGRGRGAGVGGADGTANTGSSVLMMSRSARSFSSLARISL